jgi:hypothetical protein
MKKANICRQFHMIAHQIAAIASQPAHAP